MAEVWNEQGHNMESNKITQEESPSFIPSSSGSTCGKTCGGRLVVDLWCKRFDLVSDLKSLLGRKCTM
jgi:hypothetical protein